MVRRKKMDDPGRAEKIQRTQALVRLIMAKRLQEQGILIPTDPAEFDRVRPSYAATAAYINQFHNLTPVSSQNIEHWINGKYLPNEDNPKKLGLAWGFTPEIASRNIEDYIQGIRNLEGQLLTKPFQNDHNKKIVLPLEAWEELSKISIAAAIRAAMNQNLIGIFAETTLPQLFQTASAIALGNVGMSSKLISDIIKVELQTKGLNPDKLESLEQFAQAGQGFWDGKNREILIHFFNGTLPKSQLKRSYVSALAATLAEFSGNRTYALDNLSTL